MGDLITPVAQFECSITQIDFNIYTLNDFNDSFTVISQHICIIHLFQSWQCFQFGKTQNDFFFFSSQFLEFE